MPKQTDLLIALDVCSSAIHGRGVFAAQDIPMGAHIGRYSGRRLASEDELPSLSCSAPTYLFALSDGSFIDGARGGNATRFINHSCVPNCVAFEVETGRGASIVIESAQPISKGRELLLDYALDVADADIESYPCQCGASKCRGTMVGSSTA